MDAAFDDPGDLSDPTQLSNFFRACAALAGEAHFVCSSIPDVNLDHAETVARKLHTVRAILVLADFNFPPDSDRAHILNLLDRTIAYLDAHLEDPHDWERRSGPARSRTGRRGAPRLVIDAHRAVELYDLGGTWTRISRLMGTNRETIRQRVRALPEDQQPVRTITQMTDDEVDGWVNHLHEEHPFVGSRIIMGHLRHNGIFLTRLRVQESLRRVDELGVQQRWGKYIRRRVYHVSGANALWHMDGNEKLKPWGFYVHGCIDGYSRRIVYCMVSNNKRAATVAGFFTQATAELGWPSRMRGDFGTENNGVERLMHERWDGHHAASFLRGKSQQNVRIERFWRDLRKDSLETYRIVFMHLENCGWFDIERLSHRTCLYLTFRSRVQGNIDESIGAWNNHALSSEHDQTPLMLYEFSKFEQLQNGSWPGQNDEADEWYGVEGGLRGRMPRSEGREPEAPRPEPPEPQMRRAGVYVCSDEELEWVKSELPDFDFDRPCDNWGVGVYRDAVERLLGLHPDIDHP